MRKEEEEEEEVRTAHCYPESAALRSIAINYASDDEEQQNLEEKAAQARTYSVLMSSPTFKRKVDEGIIEEQNGLWYDKSTELYTCMLCGNTWDGNAQCFPCIYY